MVLVGFSLFLLLLLLLLLLLSMDERGEGDGGGCSWLMALYSLYGKMVRLLWSRVVRWTASY